MKYRIVAKKLRRLGCEEIPARGSGSHRIWMNPDKETEASIPDWRGKDLKKRRPPNSISKIITYHPGILTPSNFTNAFILPSFH